MSTIKKEHIENIRFPKLIPTNPTSLESWRNTISKEFPTLLFPAEVGMSVLAQLLIKDITNPFALVYIDAPSSGKTIVLNFFSEVKELIYTTDNFTPASFVSHASNIKKSKLAENDLLPKIRYKTLMIRDLAPIFAKRDEDVREAIGILVRVLDGEGYETNSGLYGKRGYIGDYLFMLLSASTPIRPKIWNIMGNLGSRLFFLHINSPEKSKNELAKQLLESCKNKEILCRQKTTSFIQTLWSANRDGINWNTDDTPHEMYIHISHIASVLALMRGAINSTADESISEALQEKPDRLNQLLYNLARGHAVIHGRKFITKKDIKMIFHVALDSAPLHRATLFMKLISNNGTLTTKDIMNIFDCCEASAGKKMTEMCLLKITFKKQIKQNKPGNKPLEIKLVPDLEWFLTEKYNQFT